MVLIEEETYNDYKEKGKLLDNYHYYFLNDLLREYIENNKIRISSRSITA